MPQVTETSILGVVILQPKRFGDDRGYFSETYNQEALRSLGIDHPWMQDNEAFSTDRYTLRGLHFQRPPYAQTKLVRAVQGKVLDVCVDLRSDSPTFGQHIAVELSAELGNQLLVPKGIAHGYLTLTESCLVAYKVDAPYAPDHDTGLLWSDPILGIEWPTQSPLLSEKDKAQPLLSELGKVF